MNHRVLLLLAGGALSLLLCPDTAALLAAEKKPFKDVDIDALIGETQKGLGSQDSTGLVWIIPIEFWRASLFQDKSVTEVDREAVLSALDKYLMVGVVRADISRFGAMNFHNEKKVFATLKVTLVKTKEKPAPLALMLKADNDDAQIVINSMKPLMKAALGKMGDNFHLFVCNNHDEAGRRLVSPYETGKVSISMAPLGKDKGGTLEFDLPLDSLHVPRVCAECGKQAHVSWSYCPYCGKKHAR